MNISKNLEKMFNAQMVREIASSHLYANMAGMFFEAGLNGFAKLLDGYAKEELTHYQKQFEFVADRNGRASVGAIPDCQCDYESVYKTFVAIWEHEQQVTKFLTELYDAAVKENDYVAQQFLDWFMNEQIEEERKGFEMMKQLKLVGDDKTGIVLLDKELQ